MQRLEIAGQIQEALAEKGLKPGELVSYDEAITMDFTTPSGENFVMVLHLAPGVEY